MSSLRPTTAESATLTVGEKRTEESTRSKDENADIEKASTKDEAQVITQSVAPSGPPQFTFPDGGRDAWKVVAGAWLVSFCTMGYVNAFGVFQEYYQTNQLSTYTPSDISWIGSVQLSMIFWGGLPCGRLFDLGYLRAILIVGSVWLVFCVMMTSLATEYYQILLAQGIGIGIGMGILFLPALGCIPHWFRRRRSLANGILASGSSIGGIIFPVMINKMAHNPNIGFAWAVRTTGFLILVMLVLANFLLKTRLPPNTNPGPLVDLRVFKDINFSLFIAGGAFILLGLYLPIFYIEEFALINGVNSNLAFYTLAILNAASLFGRTIPNYLADSMGSLNVLIAACTVSAILIFVFLVLKSAASFVVFSIFFGFFSGAYVSTIAACIASLTTDMRTIGLRMSMGVGAQGFAALLGTPIDGWIITRQKGSFTGAACFSGISVLFGCTLVFLARTRHAAVKGTARI